MNKFSERIKELRIEKGMRQCDLANLVGISRASVADWETGRHEPPLDTIIALCKIFDVSTDYLLGITD